MATSAADSPEPVVDLGPFSPPGEFAHSSVFVLDPPRPLPDNVVNSRYATSRRKLFWVLAIFAIACLITAPLPFVRAMSWYFLPLGYLIWIGLALAFAAAVVWYRNATSQGLLKYPLEGKVIVGRVRELTLKIEGIQEAPEARVVAAVEFTHPETNTLTMAAIAAPDTFPLAAAPQMHSGVSEGEYVSLAYIPGDVEKSLAIYGWLGVDQECDLVTQNGKPMPSMSLWNVILGTAAIIGVVWLLLGAVYVLSVYSPLEERWDILAIVTAIISIPMVILLVPRAIRTQPSRWPTGIRYLAWTLACVIFSGLIGFVVTGFINGYWDRSELELQPIQVVNTWQTTTNFIFREYELEYHAWPIGDTRKQGVPVTTLADFSAGDLGVIGIGKGALGMRWVRGFYPLMFQDVTRYEARYPGEIQCRLPHLGEEIRRLAPRVRVSQSESLPVPDAIFAEGSKQLIQRLRELDGFELIEPME